MRGGWCIASALLGVVGCRGADRPATPDGGAPEDTSMAAVDTGSSGRDDTARPETGASDSGAGDTAVPCIDGHDVVIDTAAAAGPRPLEGAYLIPDAADLTYHGPTDLGTFGSGIVPGDFDGDGATDLAVMGSTPGIGDVSRIFYFKGPIQSVAEPWVADAVVEDPYGFSFGWTITGVGDIDRDGKDEILFLDNLSFYNAVRVLGDAITAAGENGGTAVDITSVSDVVISGEAPGYGGVGTGLHEGAVDVNGDGFDDLLVGNIDWFSDALYAPTGAVHLLHGPFAAAVDVTTAVTAFRGEEPHARTGYHTELMDDVDGDGLGDILILAPGNILTDAGNAVYMAHDPPAGDISVGDMDHTFLPGDALLSYMGALGDLNQDGYADFQILSAGASVSAPESGAVYVYYGPAPACAVQEAGEHADAVITSAQAYSDMIWPNPAGDVDGDGYDDMLVGLFDTTTEWLFYGPVPLGTLEAESAAAAAFEYPDSTGMWTDRSGDVDQDGYSDLLFANPNYDPPGAVVDGGAVWILFGGP